MGLILLRAWDPFSPMCIEVSAADLASCAEKETSGSNATLIQRETDTRDFDRDRCANRYELRINSQARQAIAGRFA